jgi:L,D-transpeptidase YcbB
VWLNWATRANIDTKVMTGVTIKVRILPVLAASAAFGLAIQPALAQRTGGSDPVADAIDRMASDPGPDAEGKEDEAPAAPVTRGVAPASPAADPGATISEPVVQEIPDLSPVMFWTKANALALLDVIQSVDAEGLNPADYRPDALIAAIEGGEGDTLDQAASRSFTWLVEDLRDGRTPMTARVQWFAVDPDQDENTTEQLMAKALTLHDVKGVLASLAPTHPDYQALKEELAITPKENKARRALIQANMDRWRWLARDLGKAYIITNVPEFQLRLVVNNKNIRTYRTIVGKPGRTATPQLAETVSAVVFNPTWTVPQSIVKGEGLGNRVLGNPGWARSQGYKATRAADGTIYVVQQPGPGNALGLMKIDMPNPHAIYFHDTPNKNLFNAEVRAFSHGCIRTERAVELGMTLAILGAEMDKDEAARISKSGEYTKVAMSRTFPAYITYFTFARSIDGDLRKFADIYGRDKPVLDSFAAPRQPKTGQRKSDEEIIQLDNPL